MTTSLHKDLAIAELHRAYAFEYANAAARTGASGFVAADVGKFARQLDDNSIWMLTATTPTWQQINMGGASGEANTASNVGTAGVGVFKQKTGVDLEFKKVNAGSAKVTITDDTGNDEVDVDVVTGATANSVCVGNDSRLSDARTPTSHASTHNAGGGDALAIDAAAGTGSLRTLGTSSTAACAGNDSRLSDARTPTSHASTHQSGGGDTIKLDDLAAPDDNTDLNASTSKHGLLLKLGGGTTNYLRADGTWAAPPGGGSSIAPDKMFQADQLESPNSSDWAVNSLASLETDNDNVGLVVRAFDDSTDEGVGFTVRIPTGATNIVLGFLSRAKTAPGSAQVVALDLYKRSIPDNAAVGSWSSATSLTDLNIPTNENYQKDSQTIALTTLGLTVGVTYQFELIRDVSGDALSGDWLLHSLTVGWT